MFEIFGYQIFLSFLAWRLFLIVAVVLLVYKCAEKWIQWVRLTFWENQKWNMIMVRAPRDVFRSPAAMEFIFNNVLWQTGGTGTWYALFWAGKVRQTSSVEIVSVEGSIYFFFRVWPNLKDYLISQIYAQYPDAEVSEVDDYVKYVPPFRAKSGNWQFNAFELRLEKADPYPIKTYVDYGLDKPGLEAEETIDPISNVLELLATLGPTEQIWIHIYLRAAAARPKSDHPYKHHKDWQSANSTVLTDYENEIKKQMAGDKFTELYPDLAKKRPYEFMTDLEKEVYTTLQRNLAKNAFDVGIRCAYLAERDKYRVPIFTALMAVWRVFSHQPLNSFGLMNVTLAPDYDFQNFLGIAFNKKRQDLYDASVLRSYFYPPFNETEPGVSRKRMVLTSEELATVFHFPSRAVETNQIMRVEAKKSEPPGNLPV